MPSARPRYRRVGTGCAKSLAAAVLLPLVCLAVLRGGIWLRADLPARLSPLSIDGTCPQQEVSDYLEPSRLDPFLKELEAGLERPTTLEASVDAVNVDVLRTERDTFASRKPPPCLLEIHAAELGIMDDVIAAVEQGATGRLGAMKALWTMTGIGARVQRIKDAEQRLAARSAES